MLIDAHSHVDRYNLVDEHALRSALDEIAQHGILTISNSMDVPSYQHNLKIAEKCEWVVPTFGVHPWNAPEHVDSLHELDGLIEQSPMIGEVGLDHYFVDDSSAYPAQRKVLEHFVSAAREQDKLISLHTKGAEKEVLELLQRYDASRVIVHWYSGPLDILRELAAMGVYFTVGVAVQHSKHIQAVAAEIPLQQLLTETDNPGGPKDFVGGPGMPVLLKDVVRGLAETRNTTSEAVEKAVQANFMGLLGEDPRLASVRAKLRTMSPREV